MTFKRFLLLGLVGLLAMPCATVQAASVRIGIGIGIPVFYRPCPPPYRVVVAPAPVYVAPPPVVYVQPQPAPVYVQQPAPVYVQQPLPAPQATAPANAQALPPQPVPYR